MQPMCTWLQQQQQQVQDAADVHMIAACGSLV
jgi:hypothetical protein